MILSCKNGRSLPASKDICLGSHLIYYYDSRTYSRQEKEDVINNNRFACEVCKDYLDHIEQAICELWLIY